MPHLKIINKYRVFICYLSFFEKKNQECKKTPKGAEYKGHLNVTVDGLLCQRWDQQIQHRHQFTDHYLFPDKNVTLANNFCRNPGASKEAPWCYTKLYPIIWQYCDVPDCGKINNNDLVLIIKLVLAETNYECLHYMMMVMIVTEYYLLLVIRSFRNLENKCC